MDTNPILLLPDDSLSIERYLKTTKDPSNLNCLQTPEILIGVSGVAWRDTAVTSRALYSSNSPPPHRESSDPSPAACQLSWRGALASKGVR